MNEKRKTFLNTNRMTARALFATFILLLLSTGAASGVAIRVDDGGGGANYTQVVLFEGTS